MNPSLHPLDFPRTQGQHGYQGHPQPSAPYAELEQPSPPQTSPSSSYSPGALQNGPPTDATRGPPAPPQFFSNSLVPGQVHLLPPLSIPAVPQGQVESVAKFRTKSSASRSPTTSKARRVRTGCFTCRDRHLKCDETTPRCIKCIKGDRECKYGVRLSWMDSNATVKNPPKLVSPIVDWSGGYLCHPSQTHTSLMLTLAI